MSIITVQMLGGFQIRVDGKLAFTSLSGSKKAMAVLQYLLLQKGEPVSHQVLIDAIWQYDRADNPDMALRAMLHRIRSAVKQENIPALTDCVVTKRGYYQWNPALNCMTDVEQILTCSATAATARSEGHRSKLYAKIVELYKGHLLPERASEAWVEGRSVRLRGIWHNALLRQIETLKQQNLDEQLVALCRRAIALDNYEERFYLELIMALDKLGRHDEAQEVTRAGTAVGCLHHNLAPHLVPAVLSRAGKLDADTIHELDSIADELGRSCINGAQLCGYVTFQELYALQMGIQERHGLPTYLGLLTLRPNAPETYGEHEAAMTLLGNLICQNLRQSDIAAQYGSSQYVIMFCGGLGDGKSAPLERVKTAFYQTPEGSRYLLGYCLKSPVTSMDEQKGIWGGKPKNGSRKKARKAGRDAE